MEGTWAQTAQGSFLGCTAFYIVKVDKGSNYVD